jgi:hypothetical protein
MMGLILVMGLAVYQTVGLEAYAQNFGVNRNIVPAEIVAATGGEDSFIDLVRTILNFFLGFLGIVSLAIVIYGGFVYVTAGVNEGAADTGKKILTFAAIGILIILLSFVLVNTLLQAAVPGAAQ